ncbi:unnamed protein product [Closterium sp. NIES-53]
MAPGDLTNRDADPSLPAVAAESRGTVKTVAVDETHVNEGLRLRKLRLGKDDQKRQTLHVPKAHVRSADSASPSSLQATPEPVSPVGRLFLDDDFYTTILCVLEFKNEMEIKELRDILQHTLLQHPRFHSRLVSSPGGVPAWVLMDAADVDLEYHVVEEEASDVDSSQRHVAGDEGGGGGGKGGEEERGGGGEGEGALESQVVRLQSLPPFDPNRPLWQVHLIHLPAGTRPSEPRQRHSAAVFRIHHALGDGISLMSLLLAATRRTDNPDLLPSLPGSLGASTRQKTSSSSEPPLSSSDGSSSGTNRSSISEGGSSKGKEAAAELSRKKGSFRRLLTLLWVALVRAVLAVWRMVRVIVNTTMQILEYLAVLLWVADTPTPIKGGPHLHCHALPRCFAVSPEMSLEDVSTIRKAVKGTTVNDVMLTVISGGIERYLVLLGITNGGSPLPHRLRVSALALFNLRPAPGLQELSELMAGQRSQARWGNHLGNILLPLPIYSRAQGRSYRPSQQSDSEARNGETPRQQSDLGDKICRGGEEEGEGRVGKGEEEQEGRVRRAEEVERLGAMRALCASRKDSLMAHWTYLNGRLLMPLVGCKPVAALTRRSLDQTTLSLSNVVGPLEEVALHGHPIAAIIPSVVGSNHALTCHIQTYKGAARIVVSAVKQNVPNPHMLCRCFLEAFRQLNEEVKTIV